MNLAVETEQESDGRWIAEIPQIPGALAYGSDRGEAISRVEALALRVLADAKRRMARWLSQSGRNLNTNSS